MLNNHNISTPVLIKDLGYIYPRENSKQKRLFGIYKCYCGKEFKAQQYTVKCGNTKSCGCYHKRIMSDMKTHGLSKSRIYQIWNGIITRTENINRNSYIYYAGRGIRMCDEWRNDFISFYDWAIKNGYSDHLSIDRIDNDGNYEPSNCRWTTQNVQARNSQKIRSTNKSGFRGVCYVNSNKKWGASITIKRKQKHIGYFNTPKEAAIAYDTFVIVYGLEHTTNFPKGIFETKLKEIK